jgi:hypothetical protein
MELVLMRRFALLCTLLAGAVLASAQNGGQSITPGYAGNWESPGMYAQPNVPLVSTPSVSLDATPVSAVGARNATAGNVAGATNSTLSIVSQPANGPFAALAWYGSGQRFSSAAGTR